MYRYRFCLLAVVALAVFAIPTIGNAQSLYSFQVSAMGGIGGSFDVEEPDSGIDNTTLQLGFSSALRNGATLGVRLGQMDLDAPEGFGNLVDAELSYATIGGEYRVRRAYYDSGIYIGLGAYQLEGSDRFTLAEADDTSVGLVLGVTAEFPITRRFSVLSELSGHVMDLDESKFFGMLHLGLAFNF